MHYTGVASMDAIPPEHTEILIIGGGPAGSTAASALAREGRNVVLLEMAHFPRYHIGESLIPSVRHYLRFIGAEQKIIDHGFARKPGSAIKFNQYMREGYTDFTVLGESNAVWNVSRSEFDTILLNHARECGAHVFEGYRVLSLDFVDKEGVSASSSDSHIPSDDGPGRPVRAAYMTDTGTRGEITFDFLVDASGRTGIMSTKYLKNRHYNTSLKNIAVWGYWRGVTMYGEGTDRENAPFFEALSDESGWAWFIPLAKGFASVGVVMDQKQLGIRSRACSNATNASQPSTTLNTASTSPVSSATASARPRASSSASSSLYSSSSSSSSGLVSRARALSTSLLGSPLSLPSSVWSVGKGSNSPPESGGVAPVPASPTPSTCSSPSLGPLSTSTSFGLRSASPTAPRPFTRFRSPSTLGEDITPRNASALADRYLSFLRLAPGVMELVGEGAQLVRVGEDGRKEGMNDDDDDDDDDSTRDEEVGVGGSQGTATRSPPMARSASDFSYSANKYAGPGYRIIGDAGAFIDPFFSSGIHLAMTGALSASASICASLRGDCTEAEAAEWCSRRIAVSYTRFLVVVLSAYKQIRAQSTKVLVDIDDDNFDKAFQFLRPVIQGVGEMGGKLCEDEVQRALDFCVNLFNPTTPEQHEAVKKKIGRLQIPDDSIKDEQPSESWMDVCAPLVDPVHITNAIRNRFRSLSTSSTSSSPPPSPSSCSSFSSIPGSLSSLSSYPDISSSQQLGCVSEEDQQTDKSKFGNREMQMVLEKVNARRVIHVDHMEGLNSLEQETVAGFVVRLTAGKLGLARMEDA